MATEQLSNLRFYCPTCQFAYVLPADAPPLATDAPLVKKEVEDVLGGAEAWDNVDSTETVCPKCGHRQAYFFQIQIRSADEPTTTFYRCCECAHQWRED